MQQLGAAALGLPADWGCSAATQARCGSRTVTTQSTPHSTSKPGVLPPPGWAGAAQQERGGRGLLKGSTHNRSNLLPCPPRRSTPRLQVHKTKAVVRFMFHNPDDVRWFRPVELWTKGGRRGRIREPVRWEPSHLLVGDASRGCDQPAAARRRAVQRKRLRPSRRTSGLPSRAAFPCLTASLASPLFC